MKLSKKVLGMAYSPIRKLNQYVQEAEEKGTKIYKLNIGQPDIETPTSFFEGLRKFDDKILKYMDSRGLSELLDYYIKKFKSFGSEVKKEDLLITNGGSEGIYFSLMTICDEGDEILVPEPFYSNYSSFAKIAGAKVVPIKTLIENDYALPEMEEIEKLITPRTRAIMFSNPGNPTGVVYTEKEIEMLCKIVLKHDLFLIGDEVYRYFIYEENKKHISLFNQKGLDDNIIVIDSISKHYSACGARIGVVYSKNREFVENFLKFCQARLAISTLDQYSASNLINTGADYIEKVRIEYKKRRDIMFDNLSNIPGVVCSKPSGALYMLIKLPVDDSEIFAKWMITEFEYEGSTVLVAPGSGFYFSSEEKCSDVRLSFCLNSEDIKKAVKILREGIIEYTKIHKK